jgi:nicotinamidase-related amidase
VAGISTDVRVTFAALSAGYQVYAVLDASGTWNTKALHRAARWSGS